MFIMKIVGTSILLIYITFISYETIAETTGRINFHGSINEPACSFSSDSIEINSTCFQKKSKRDGYATFSEVKNILEINKQVSVLFFKHPKNNSVMQIYITYR